LQPRIDVSSRASIKATIQHVLEEGKNEYIWPICQRIIEVSSRASIKARMKPVLDGCRYAYI
jgi:hypothetical protein